MIQLVRTVALALGAGLAASWLARRSRTGPFHWAFGLGIASLVFAVIAFMTLGVGAETFFFWKMPPLDAEAIYRINVDGSSLTQLIKKPLQYYPHYDGLAWCADGRRIAFSMQAPGLSGIYVMNADGANPTNLTESPSWDNNPVWSPDGREILFTRFNDRKIATYTVNVDGSDCTELADTALPCPVDGIQTWSPDGTKIAFTSSEEGNMEVCLTDSDGTGRANLTNDPAEDCEPAWSPDSTKIAFHTDSDGDVEIYVMHADGSGLLKLFIDHWSLYQRGGEQALNEDEVLTP